MDDKLPTLKAIARRLNVSVSTVSRALSNNPRIGLRTKMRVQAYNQGKKACGVVITIGMEIIKQVIMALVRLNFINLTSSSFTMLEEVKNR